MEYPPIKLLYISGIAKIDKLIEEKYQGEDVYVTFSRDDKKILLEIDDFQLFLDLENVLKINFLYQEGLITLVYFSNEYVFSYSYKIPFELLSFLINLPVKLDMPKFLYARYLQMEDQELFELIEKHRRNMMENEFIHYYDDIDELSYAGIIESFASQAIGEVPLIYIKYFDEGDREKGLLVTYNKIYAPENRIPVKDIFSVSFRVEANLIYFFINKELFTSMKVIIMEGYVKGIPFTYDEKVFPVEEVMDLIEKILVYLKK